MNWLDNIFGKKNRSPFFLKIESLVLQLIHINDIECIYYLGGGQYSEDNLQSIITALQSKQEVFFTTSYNTQSDNIELYLIKKNNQSFIALVVLDPVELYQAEEVITSIPLDSMPASSSKWEKIYP